MVKHIKTPPPPPRFLLGKQNPPCWDLVVHFSTSVQAHQEKDAKAKDAEEVKPGAVPAYLLDREQVRRTKAGGEADFFEGVGFVDLKSVWNWEAE